MPAPSSKKSSIIEGFNDEYKEADNPEKTSVGEEGGSNPASRTEESKEESNKKRTKTIKENKNKAEKVRLEKEKARKAAEEERKINLENWKERIKDIEFPGNDKTQAAAYMPRKYFEAMVEIQFNERIDKKYGVYMFLIDSYIESMSKEEREKLLDKLNLL